MQTKGHGFLYACIWLLVLANIGLLAGGTYYATHQKPEPNYAVFTKDNQRYLQTMTPISAPLYSVQVLREWAIDAATSVYTYDAANYEMQLAQAISRYFTDAGAESFNKALESSGAIEQLLSKKLIVSAVAYDTPVIISQGTFFGERSWKLQVPLLVTYQSASEKVTHRYIVTMLIVQQPTWRFSNGYGIQQFTVANVI